jgi:hypothetical protein
MHNWLQSLSIATGKNVRKDTTASSNKRIFAFDWQKNIKSFSIFTYTELLHWNGWWESTVCTRVPWYKFTRGWLHHLLWKNLLTKWHLVAEARKLGNFWLCLHYMYNGRREMGWDRNVVSFNKKKIVDVSHEWFNRGKNQNLESLSKVRLVSLILPW